MSTTSVQKLLDAQQLAKDVAFNADDLDAMWSSQAGLYVRYGVIAARAEHQASAFKNRLGIIEAELGKEAREEIPKLGQKVTEGTVKEYVGSHARMIKAHEDYNKAVLINNLAKTALEALRQRRDMIVQASKHHLEQMVMRESFKGGSAPAAREAQRDQMVEALRGQAQRTTS
ncbi:hypothetical protein TW86_03615 [Halomonas sp. S2151]|uniref:hypothetical protein n=1 Tax=Halomonas sp. S2151 TaxID=579478 RepID=UPI0005F9B8A6|nr:hypothetical protein [Halomonas sp. S2151]KJZ17359.1 hypothetical protein TW86_03615 [Halomonas sp. S2151]